MYLFIYLLIKITNSINLYILQNFYFLNNVCESQLFPTRNNIFKKLKERDNFLFLCRI
jgi:hypothetical protein